MAGRFEVRRCFAVLIDNREFLPESGLPPRVGAERDLYRIREFCQLARFTVYERLPTNNLTLVQMRQLFQDVIWQDFSEYDACIVLISSHGIKGEIRTTDGGTITVQEIVSAFEGIATLHGKPKLFFITNCLEEELILRDEARPVVPFYIPMTYDVMVGYASVDGYEYPRDPAEGSFAARVLDDVLRNHAFDMSLSEMLNIFSQRFYDSQQPDGRRQVPNYVTNLRKPVYFIKPADLGEASPV
ncbi:caspase-3-like [Dendronephthya gigantea]|uniref:caspase-3-like n=1 Tax=Dendronephthya gigantea TaxID=151771 RepID=UPI00106B7B22|nr:caspase-3-like [Dendronephthya gigantea]